jgi:hypothetical protein
MLYHTKPIFDTFQQDNAPPHAARWTIESGCLILSFEERVSWLGNCDTPNSNREVILYLISKFQLSSISGSWFSNMAGFTWTGDVHPAKTTKRRKADDTPKYEVDVRVRIDIGTTVGKAFSKWRNVASLIRRKLFAVTPCRSQMLLHPRKVIRHSGNLCKMKERCNDIQHRVHIHIIHI